MSEDQANLSVGEEDLPGSGDTHSDTAQDKLNVVKKILRKQLEGLESLQTWCEQQAHRMIIAVGQLALVEQLVLYKGVPENMRTNGGVLLAYVYSQTAKELPGLVPGNNVSQKIIRPPNVSHLRDLIEANLDFQDEDDVFDGIRSALLLQQQIFYMHVMALSKIKILCLRLYPMTVLESITMMQKSCPVCI